MRRFGVTVIGLSMLAAASAAAAVELPVAGTAPDRRPDGAPVVVKERRGPEWWGHATRGIVPPVPVTVLLALCQQGEWYTPLTRPGMPGRYDIRGLHRP